MAPTWLSSVAWIALALGVLCAVALLLDIYAAGYRQRMPIMEAVWPINALYLGPFAVWAYKRFGRPQSRKWQDLNGDPPPKPGWASTTIGVMHCGAGCTLGDIIAETTIFLLGITIAGRRSGPSSSATTCWRSPSASSSSSSPSPRCGASRLAKA